MRRLPVRLTCVAMTLLIAGLTAGWPRATAACPFCSAPMLTLSEQYSKADAALLVQWASATPSEKNKPGTTTYQIVQVLRDPLKSYEKGASIKLDRHRAGKPGDLSLLLGSKAEIIEWGSPLDVSETMLNYIVQAPSLEVSPVTRLEYFLKFLEAADPEIGNDAYAEFANAPYKEIVLVAKAMPRDKLRKWLVSPDVPVTRLGLYGLMLGLCGDASDVAIMEKKINESSDEFRLGIDGVMGGYLLLTGERGLPMIEDTKLKNKKAPFSETYAAMQALRFMWTYGANKISPERLRASMRLLLDRPDMADLVIGDLLRWKDWSVQKRLMQLYGADEYNIPSIKRAIIRYMLASTKDVVVSSSMETPPHVVEANQYLQQLRDKDPKMVSEVERYFLLQ